MPLLHSSRKKLYRPLYTAGSNVGEINLQTRTATEVSTARPSSYFGFAVSPDGAFICKMDYGSGLISFYKTGNFVTAVATCTSSSSAYGLFYSPDSRRLAVPAVGGVFIFNLNNLYNSTISDPTMMGSGAVLLSVSAATYSAAFSPDGNKVYVVGATNKFHTLTYNGTSWSETSSLAYSFFGIGVCLSPDGNTAYVAGGDPNIKVINIATNSVSATLTSAGQARAIEITPDGKKLVVAKMTTAVHIIDIASNTLTSVATGVAGGSTYDVAISPNGETAIVSDISVTKVYLINLTNNSLISAITTSPTPWNCAFLVR